MLLNEIGVESEDESVDIDTRRVGPAFDPRNRVTVTMLLQVSLSAVPRSELLATSPRVNAPISTLDAVAPIPNESAVASHIDAA